MRSNELMGTDPVRIAEDLAAQALGAYNDGNEREARRLADLSLAASSLATMRVLERIERALDRQDVLR